jgi:hypothetical protein
LADWPIAALLQPFSSPYSVCASHLPPRYTPLAIAGLVSVPAGGIQGLCARSRMTCTALD